MQIRLIKPGLLTTIQDMGRRMYLSQAVSVSGAMDTLSARIANKVLGNNNNDAVIEFTYADAEFKADMDVLIAYAGDGATLIAASQKIPAERPLFIPKGTTVKLINRSLGCRTYLSVAGGWDVPEVLGSKSTFITAGFGGLAGRALKAGDTLNGAEQVSTITQKILDSLKGDGLSYTNWSLPSQLILPADRKTIRVIPAHEFNWFDSQAILDFLSTAYIIGSNSNRMGYHLEGAVLNRVKKDELLSTAVTPGTIQVTGNGGMILLMADCQTTGGYPRMAQVALVDLPLCAQLKPGDAIYFKEIGPREAEMLYLERELQLQRLTTAVNSKFL
ncbi:biotin-dependent carboxyltransferase family protein [Mucilaginibacter sp. UR6-11]|uniref:5-oxoprolinase subunit C family protein n=1 Tax=Mucilaginibacter sp. UR6-11 TaxID=1435644 RepID=UPI001E2A4A0F|nr:biotin-dependent carboxyltransferase family protein [Mucilaginibacter sp. UR6-11]MCC8426516.1 biotin-dependent carboxyltransferase family protein [Mucilaginibacter sp. UR6-11]